ncbi:MAG: TonB-dependent receptor [Nitrospirota bacterium]
MLRTIPLILFLISLYSYSLAQDFAELKSETAEELLMFFEEEELMIATRSATPVRKAPAIATVITAQEIRNMGASNVMDVLKMVPGMGIARNEQGFFMLEVRGISTVKSEKILLMIDGHSLNKNVAESGFSYFGDNLNINNIKQIEIIRGPGSALYGANAFVAVINISTKSAEDIDGVTATAGGGSFDTQKYNLLAGKTFEDGLRIFSSIDYRKTNGANLRIEKDSLSTTPYSTAPGNADTQFEAADVFVKATYKDLTYSGHYLGNDRGVYIGFGAALTDHNSLELYNYWHELSYRFSAVEGFSSFVKIYFNRFEQDASIELMPDGYAGSYPDGMIGGPKVKDRTVGGEIQFDYDISETNHLLAGVVYEDIKQYDVKSISNFNPNTGAYLGSVQDRAWTSWNRDTNRYIFAAYIQDEWGILNNLNLTAGIRHDRYNDFGGTTNPRAGLVWSFLENADLKLLYGQAFRAPSFTELYNDNNPSLMGNQDLTPEKIKTYEAGLGYRFSDHFRIDLNYFYNDIDDLIIRDSSTSPATNANLGGAEIDGVEVVLSGNYSHDNYWQITYFWQDPEDSETGESIAYVPLNRATAGINYSFNKYLNVHTDILWTGERSRPDGDTRDPVASYTTVDLALTLKNFYKTLEIQGTVHNLLDEDYEDPDVSGASKYVPGDYPREGISGLLSVRYEF